MAIKSTLLRLGAAPRQFLRADHRSAQSATFAHLLTVGLERLALAGVISTIFLLGYWHPITLATFPSDWLSARQYQLVALYNDQYRLVNLYASDISALMTIALWLLARLTAVTTGQQSERLRLGPAALTLPLTSLIALSALSATQAIFPALSLEMALHLLLVLGFVLAVLNLRPPLWAVILPLAVLSILEGMLSIAQVQAQSTLWGHFLFNWESNAAPPQSGASIVQLPGGMRWLRAYGSFPHPNILGGFLCLALPLIAGAYLHLRQRSRLAWLLLFALMLGGLALLLSFSRAAWLGVFIGALWAGLISWQRSWRLKSRLKAAPPNPPTRVRTKAPLAGLGESAQADLVAERQKARFQPPAASGSTGLLTFLSNNINRRLVLLALLAAGLFIGLIVALGPVFQSRLLLDSSLEHQSVSERIVLLEAGVVFIAQHPWLGVGAGNMALVELAYPTTAAIGEPVHNVPLAVGVETGLLSLFLWLIPPIGVLRGIWQRRRALPPGALAASAALVALLVVAQLDHYLWSQPTGSLFYWLALALTALWQKPAQEQVSKR